MRPGTHLVNRDLEPGQYRGEAGEGFLGTCYWARLSGTSGSFDEILANDTATGVFYITVLPSDYALETACELRLAEKVPPASFTDTVPVGTHLVNRDLEPGQYRGEAGEGFLGACYWARLSGTSGSFDEILANDTATGVFYITVLPSDYALETACELRLAEKVPPASFTDTVPVGTHLVNRDLEPGQYRGEAGEGFLGACYWARLSGTSGSFDEILANDTATGVFYITVLPSDYALETACELRRE